MLDQEKILIFLKTTGPTLPSKVAKEIKTEILLASAHLSDLRSQGKIKVSNLKVGGSPLYFLPGQEGQLYRFAVGNINQKDFQVLERLKEKGVLQESSLDLISKVALRSLKDFAVPLHVIMGGKKELFWKWYLLSDEETNSIIKSMLSSYQLLVPTQKNDNDETEIITKNQSNEELKQNKETQMQLSGSQNEDLTNGVDSKLQQQKLVKDDKKIEEKVEKELEDNHEQREEQKQESKSEPVTDNSQNTKMEDKKKHEVHVNIENHKDISREELKKGSKNEFKKELKEESKKESKDESKRRLNKITEENSHLNEKKTFIQKVKEKITNKKNSSVREDFMPVIEDFFNKLNIKIEEHDIVRKNTEVNLFVKVPSVVGCITHFCKAKNKAKCDEKDLSSAYMEARVKKLPLLFIYTKEITKKGYEMLDSGAFENSIIKKIE